MAVPYTITAMDLEVRADVPEIGEEDFQRAAAEADDQCSITKALRSDVEVRLSATPA